jgi:hypothetical protein
MSVAKEVRDLMSRMPDGTAVALVFVGTTLTMALVVVEHPTFELR